MSLLESLPIDSCNTIFLFLEAKDLCHLCSVSKMLKSICGSDNPELWNSLLCQRLWTVDPSKVLTNVIMDSQEKVDWHAQFQRMVRAAKEHQEYLDHLKRLDLEGWLERHFVGQLAPHWNGWERRFWSWTSDTNSFSAFEDDTKRHCYADFPVSAVSLVRRVSEEEQIAMTSSPGGDDRNSVTDPKPYVFTITNTSFALLWACDSEEQLQTWLDKISVTLHPLQFEGRTYQAPAKYLLPRKRPTFE